MATLVARNDAVVVQQVTTLTPTVVNSALYSTTINGKSVGTYTADGSATAQEIVEGYLALLNDTTIPEFNEMTWAEDNAIITCTGLTTGLPFTVVDASSGGGALTVANSTVAKSPNHWIAQNFSGGSLPANGDTVILTSLTALQGFLYGLAQSAVTLAVLEIKADSEAPIGLPEVATGSGGSYYQASYRATHLAISASVLRIGDGNGQGASYIKLDLGTNACDATVFQTTTAKADQDEAPVHLVGAHASNTLQVIQGEVDIAMLPGYTATWPVIVASGGVVRCGSGVTLTTVEAAGSSLIETRSAATTIRTRDEGRIKHIGSGSITTLDIAGGVVEIHGTGTLTITTLNGYGGKSLDLSRCDSLVTVTNMNVYGTPDSPFTIRDPNNRLVMTNPASTPNGAQSLVVVTGSGRNVRIT